MAGKVSIIGAGGRVGSTTAYALQLGGVVNELALIDVFMAEQVKGEVLDLIHGNAFTKQIKITSGGYEELAGSDIVVITSGLRRQPDEERLALMNRNAKMFQGIIAEVKAANLAPSTVILVVSNPVDILTYIAVKESRLPANQVLGLGTVLDTCRFRSLLADKFNLDATKVEISMFGEHGDTMVPVWSLATYEGKPLSSVAGWNQAEADAVAERARKSGAEVISLKGGAGPAVGVSIRQVVQAILGDTNEVLPVSSLQTGAYGISDVALSLPTTVGRAGVLEVHTPTINDSEKSLLMKSAEHLKNTLAQVD
jgi:L-lactate dehydrogenase